MAGGIGASGSRWVGGASVMPPTGLASPKNGLTDITCSWCFCGPLCRAMGSLLAITLRNTAPPDIRDDPDAYPEPPAPAPGDGTDLHLT